MDTQTLEKLRTAARQAARQAYAPYSRFPVGAAVLGADGVVYAGCNVENASYPLTQCAERGAISTMVAAGCREIAAVVVYTPTATPSSPCGACRQVINEFGPEAAVLSFCEGEGVISEPLSALLPYAFGPGNLIRKEEGPEAAV